MKSGDLKEAHRAADAWMLHDASPEPKLFLASVLEQSGKHTEAKAIVEQLVACGTRHSLSSWTDPKRGIGCGRDAVVRRFDAVEKAYKVERWVILAIWGMETSYGALKDNEAPDLAEGLCAEAVAWINSTARAAMLQ